jgi:hypothetical protein
MRICLFILTSHPYNSTIQVETTPTLCTKKVCAHSRRPINNVILWLLIAILFFKHIFFSVILFLPPNLQIYTFLFLIEHIIENAKLNKNAQICPLGDPNNNIQISAKRIFMFLKGTNLSIDECCQGDSTISHPRLLILPLQIYMHCSIWSPSLKQHRHLLHSRYYFSLIRIQCSICYNASFPVLLIYIAKF